MNTCPLPEQLVDLIDEDDITPSASELRTHVEVCPDCQAQLQMVRSSYAVLGKSITASEQTALGTEEASSLARVHQALRREIVDEQQAPLVMFQQGIRAVVLVLGALAVWRLALHHLLAAPLGLLLLTLPLLLPLVLLRSERIQRVGLGLGVILVVSVMASSTARGAGSWPAAMGCLVLFGSGVMGPAVALATSVRRFATASLRAAILGMAIGSGGAALQHSLCPLGGLTHLIGVHLLPLVIGVSLLAWFCSRRMTNSQKSYGPA